MGHKCASRAELAANAPVQVPVPAQDDVLNVARIAQLGHGISSAARERSAHTKAYRDCHFVKPDRAGAPCDFNLA